MSSGSWPGFLKDLLLSLAARFVPLAIRLLIATWSFRVVNRRVFEAWVNSRRPLLAAVWHQMLLPGMAFFRDRGVVLLVSRSRDGEAIARAVERLGFRVVRGSSSRSGAEGLRELIGALRQGAQGAITVYGPRGPARHPKPGCVAAARAAGVPILPIACRADRALHARSWDRTVIPLPFARIAVSFGDPFFILGDEPEGEALRRVRSSLDRAEEAAEGALRR